MRDYERKLAEVGTQDAQGASPSTTKSKAKDSSSQAQPGNTGASEVASSSAQDVGSDGSMSDVPVSVLVVCHMPAPNNPKLLSTKQYCSCNMCVVIMLFISDPRW